MATVDSRTSFHGDAVDLDPSTFLERVPALVEANGAATGRGVRQLQLRPLTLEVEGESLSFSTDADGPLQVERGAQDELVIALDRAALSDLLQDVTSTFWLQFTGRAEVRTGTLDEFIGWEPALRSLIDGRPVYETGSIEFHDRSGGPLDLTRSFTIDDDHGEIGHFLAEAGFLHLRSLFTTEEMAAVSAELDAAIAKATQDDGASWWARTENGWYPSRILGFNHQSPTLRELLHSDRFRSIGTVTDDIFIQRDPDTTDAAEGLLKKVGVLEGPSDVSWHKDCSPGGHSRDCAGLVVGVSVTGAQRKNGELGVVAGSHRANVVPLGIEGLDLPKLPLPTQTGDITVHSSCTLHMSRPPISAERRVVYTGFNLAPRDGDHNKEVDPAEVRRQRAETSDQARRNQQERESSRMASFEL